MEIFISKKIFYAIKILIIIIISFFLISPTVLGVLTPTKKSYNNEILVSKISKKIDLKPNSDYFVRFNSKDLKIEEKNIDPYTINLSEKIILAISKAPIWIRQDLSRKFSEIKNPDEYADLIINVSKKYTDEIAFSIAYSSTGKVPSAKFLFENVYLLYEYDKWICYADIIDYDEGDGNYYSTVRYKIIEDGEEKYLEYPYEIYYRYIVFPGICGEDVEYVYDKTWRDYFFNHNDIGYPLLKEKLSGIGYLWDCKSYSQPSNRIWKWSMENHPTAIEAISYWIGKTVPYEALGDRPNQPNIIVHEHNGYCGELQRIAVPALRTGLIASIGACNIGEDHVWREFYERGWHQNDNWWTDGGGNVDQPHIYQYGWGKYMSAVFAWKGDDSIYDVTHRYIHPEDRTTIKFIVRDSFLQPLDGARVTVTVEGIKDVSWIKFLILEKMQEIWDKIPDVIKGRILQTIYNKIYERIDDSDNIVDGLTVTTWNYSDMNGECQFELGKNHKYIFVIQHGNNLRKPWQLAKNNAIRFYNNTENKIFNIMFCDFSRKITKNINHEIPSGEVLFNVSFDSSYYQLQKSVKTDDFGSYTYGGMVDCFFVDEKNFEKYKNNRFFKSYNYFEASNKSFNIWTKDQDWYIVFRNNAKHTNIILDLNIEIKADFNGDVISIVKPDTNLFDTPIFNVGDKINFSGIASDVFNFSIDNEIIQIIPSDGKWYLVYDTKNLIPGDFLVTATCNEIIDELFITLTDEYIPEIIINKPLDGEIVEDNILFISGESYDNFGIDKIEIAMDNENYIEAIGNENWYIDWNISNLEIGDHSIYVKATDLSGNLALSKTYFTKNESGHSWCPKINDFYHLPENPTNISNMKIYANITKNNPFDIKSVLLFYNNGSEIKSFEMYEYANYPIQERHPEDPLLNETNQPIYGIELGQFTTGETVNYWIKSYDTANNSIVSDSKSFEIL